MNRFLHLFAPLALAACNPSNTHDACTDIAHSWCQQLFTLSSQGCANATDYLANRGYTSLNDCASGFTFFQGATCANTGTGACEPEDYNGGRASTCAGQVGQLDCNADFDAGPQTEECKHICCLHEGNLGAGIECCSGSSHLSTTTSCGFTTTESICD